MCPDGTAAARVIVVATGARSTSPENATLASSARACFVAGLAPPRTSIVACASRHAMSLSSSRPRRSRSVPSAVSAWNVGASPIQSVVAASTDDGTSVHCAVASSATSFCFVVAAASAVCERSSTTSSAAHTEPGVASASSPVATTRAATPYTWSPMGAIATDARIAASKTPSRVAVVHAVTATSTSSSMPNATVTTPSSVRLVAPQSTSRRAVPARYASRPATRALAT
mmetsp:Transcript_22465/g.89185  ORF Transcript_22465/g.89185 Transcript_22465/m.89185 type:complete len:229 (-) Transcript_22465:138-824(-)